MRTAANAQRRSMLVLVIAVALATCLLAFLASRPAEAAGRYKVVTRPFSSETEVLVPADTTTRVGPASPYPRRSASPDSGRAASST